MKTRTQQEIVARRQAAELVHELRAIPLKGDWTRREWNQKIRETAHTFIRSIARFHLANH